MAQNTVTALERRIKASIETAATIYRDLNTGAISPAVNDRIEALIKVLEKCCSARENLKITSEYEGLDDIGVKLWNLAINLMKDSNEHYDDDRIAINDTIRLFKVALSGGKACANQNQLSWALKIMEKAAQYQQELGQEEAQSVEGKTILQQLSGEYFTLRMRIAWKQSNLSTAEYMYNKIMTLDQSLLEMRTFEGLAEVLFEIGDGLFLQGILDAAIKWLRRAFEVLSNQNILCLSEEGSELRFSVMHNLAKACILNKSPEDLQYARNTLDVIAEDWPTRMAVHLLRLDILAAESPDAVEDYYNVIAKMVLVVQMSEQVFRTVPLACKCLDELLTKLLLLNEDNWIEQTFITRLWMSVKVCVSIEGNTLTSLKRLIELLGKQTSKPLSSKSTHAAQILLWKVSEALLSQEKYKQASEWCEVALHKVFNKSGDLNYAKIARRIIHCCIQLGDYSKAIEIYNNMSETGKQNPSTLFLMFKIALRTSNCQLAESSMRGICETPLRDYRALYACVLDAHAIGNENETLTALKHVLRHMDNLPSESINKPAVLRCAIRLTVAILERANGGEISNVESLCRLLELAFEEAKKSRTKRNALHDTVFTVKELEWFARASYNLGLKSVEEWHPTTSNRIICSCIKFLGLYPEDIDTITQGTNISKAIYCHFLCSSLETQIARDEDNTEVRLQHYIEAKRHIGHFRTKQLLLKEGISQEIKWDLKDKCEEFSITSFSASIHLKDWDSLSTLVAEAEHCENGRVVQYFGDMVLRSQAPDRTIMPLMKKEKQYPQDELHWLATTAWNRAIEFKWLVDALKPEAYHTNKVWLSVSDQGNYKIFGELAMNTAKLLDDGGKLLARVQKRYLREGWD
ncbi:meiosis protein SPO22/ZIP4 like-domain-containing protein [Kalaharituber pfeilii]|nr:meiosis protein SPO22/ZIP4 like-domain-containing protein [Kalaharituber pfeilii]